jgi:ParB-like chromosome segregation protein Spo0J
MRMSRVRKHSKDVVMLPLEAITLIENPRIHPERELEGLMESIRMYGFVDPIFVAGSDNVLISGYARYEAVRRLGLQDIPALSLDLDEKEYRAMMIISNRLAELASWDYQAFIKLVEDEIALNEVRLPDIGFSEEEFNDLRNWQDDIIKGGYGVSDFADQPVEKEVAVVVDTEKVVEVVMSYPVSLWERNRVEVESDLTSLATKFNGLRFSVPKVRVKKSK